MIHRYRRLGAVILAIGCMCLLAACGSSSKSGSGSTGTNPAGHFSPTGFKLTSAQQSCLKKKGVTFNPGGFRRGAPGKFKGRLKGKFPKGKFPNGKFPKGKFPKGAHGGFPGGGFAGSSKYRAAFKACGVNFPSRPAGAPSSTTG